MVAATRCCRAATVEPRWGPRRERAPVHRVVAGAGPLEEWLKKKATGAMQGKIKLLGHLDKETLADYYANADVFVHPNPKEPFGIGPLEAMASGVPVVVPNADRR